MKTYRVTCFYFLAIVFIVSLLACAGSPDISQKSESVPGVEKIQLTSIDLIQMRMPLEVKFDNIIFRSFESTDQFKKDYPHACLTCKASIITQLKSKKTYKNVTDNVNQNLPGRSLFVDMKVVDMRIAGTQARIWGGAFAGNSHMDVLLELIDADSEEVLHKRCYQRRIPLSVQPGLSVPVTRAYLLTLAHSWESIFLELFLAQNKNILK